MRSNSSSSEPEVPLIARGARPLLFTNYKHLQITTNISARSESRDNYGHQRILGFRHFFGNQGGN